MGKLTDKVAKGVFWVLLEKFGIQAAHFVVTLVLARLLTPDDYGTVALLSVFIAVSNILIDAGFGNALIQKKNATQTDFNTVFYISVTTAVVLYTGLFFSAPFIARFYKLPELTTMLRVLAVTIVFFSINGVQNAELARKMLFKLSFRISWVRVCVMYATGVSMAYAGFGPWALVWSQVAGGLAGMLARQLVIRWRPTMTFSWASARSLFSFGWKMTLGGVISKLYGNLYAAVVGKCFTKADLSFVNKGNHVAGILMNSIDQTIGRVSFPALAKMQGDPERLRGAMRRMIRSSTFLVFPLMAVLAVVAAPAVSILFGEKWLPAAPYLRIACFTYAVKPFSSVNVRAIVARGESGTFLALVIINRLVGITAMALSWRYGVYAFVASSAYAVGIGRIFINSYPNWRILGYSIWMQLADVLPAALAAAGAAAAAFAAGMAIAPLSFWRIVAALPAAAAAYLAIAYVFRMSAFADIAKAVRPTFEKKIPMSARLFAAVERRFSK
ncbi:MAG: lipopolysaccharide biosynthesis protein [Kiritimatiellae bacterium]|nr:lipopolysaccharide biosynthesis protein [Kiritimatiellia bacterium]